jgi:hypothetical protein
MIKETRLPSLKISQANLPLDVTKETRNEIWFEKSYMAQN